LYICMFYWIKRDLIWDYYLYLFISLNNIIGVLVNYNILRLLTNWKKGAYVYLKNELFNKGFYLRFHLSGECKDNQNNLLDTLFCFHFSSYRLSILLIKKVGYKNRIIGFTLTENKEIIKINSTIRKKRKIIFH
jgi:hypothetical protein